MQYIEHQECIISDGLLLPSINETFFQTVVLLI